MTPTQIVIVSCRVSTGEKKTVLSPCGELTVLGSHPQRLAKPFAPRHLVVDTSPFGVMEDVSSHLKQLMPSNMAVSFQEVQLVVPPTPTMNLLIRDLAS